MTDTSNTSPAPKAVPEKATVKPPLRRRAVQDALDAMVQENPQSAWHAGAARIFKHHHERAVERVRERFAGDRRGGLRAAQVLSRIADEIVRLAGDFITSKLYPNANPTDAERLAVVATGGYGRGELAPFSDLDIMFLTPFKPTAWGEQVIEALLYMLWDSGFKVGHAVRTTDEAMKLAATDLTIATSLLETRPLWGEPALADQLLVTIREKLIGQDSGFVEKKLGERDDRHSKLGDTRYVVEPNVKDGKGGLRDLQTMWWIIRYLYQGAAREEIIRQGILSEREYRQFRMAEDFLWTVRVALHFTAGRAEERLTFGHQQALAKLLDYREGPGNKQVERFMKHYFIVAKQVGDLTRIFCAVLEERSQKKTLMERFRFRRRVRGFRIQGQRLTLMQPDDFKKNPIKIIEIFEVMMETGLDIHPDCLRAIKADLFVIDDSLRTNPAANAHFMTVLTSANGSDATLRRMNEAGVFGRFVPDFGRVVAQMQFDMYHHFTVDEHTIQAVGLVSKIEAGLLTDDHPVASEMIHKLVNRRVLYVAVLLHDIAKGRPGDHSIVGADIARSLCPRLGMSDAETETVAWLVRWHLLMSHTAFKRDLSDPKTVEDFCAQVKSPERLRLLIILTVVDIRAVGPGVWNAWKGQLLRELYHAAEERLVAGHAVIGRQQRVQAQKDALAHTLTEGRHALSEAAVVAMLHRWRDAYWIAEDLATIESNARLIAKTHDTNVDQGIDIRVDRKAGITQIGVYARDRLGLFAHIVGALNASGARIRSAKIHTALDGAAMDNFTVQDQAGKALSSARGVERLNEALQNALAGRPLKRDRIVAPKSFDSRIDAFEVEPVVLIDNKASNRATVIEVGAKDRPGFLYDLANALFRLKLNVFSAHINTYGERVVDVFYVTEKDGTKPIHPNRLRNIEAKLMRAAAGDDVEEAAA